MQRPRVAKLILLSVLLPLGCSEPQLEPVDLLITNANILTVDGDFSRATTMAIADGRIVAVGDAGIVARLEPAERYDLNGATLIPGFNDSHSHIASYARHYIALSGIDSISAIQSAVRSKIAALPPGSWITGYGWSEDELAEGRRPLRDDLDAVAPNNPVLLTRAGGHSAVANSAALALAEITTQTPQPEGGVIEVDDNGRLNGIIRERQDLVSVLIPDATAEELETSLRASLTGLLPLGITSVTHASEQIDRWDLWRNVYADHGDQLPRASVQMHWRGNETMAQFRASAEADLDTQRLRLGPIKIFVDGGFTGPAAFTKAPYNGEATYRGYLNMTEDELSALIDEAHGAGWQLGIHAIGDAAIELTVATLAETLREHPRADHRHYLNHFSMRPSDDTMATMAEHGIAITQQPNFTYTLAGRYSTYLDGWRLEHNNPLRGPMDAGVFVAISSDILPIGPMVGLYAATTRTGMDGRVYGAEEAISMEEAITAYTHGGAWLSFEDASKGRLAPGMLADFIVLDQDPTQVRGKAILDIEVRETWIGGKRVWQRTAEP